MKYFVNILALLLVISCENKKEEQQKTFRPGFLDYGSTTNVNVNGTDVLKYMKAIKFLYDTVPSRVELMMNSSDEIYEYYYPINILVNQSVSGTYGLHSLGSPDTTSIIVYSKVCCYSIPDVSYWIYVTDEADSLNNYIRIHIDSTNQNVSGTFKARFIHFNSMPFDGPDTIWMQCDTFNCSYSNQQR